MPAAGEAILDNGILTLSHIGIPSPPPRADADPEPTPTPAPTATPEPEQQGSTPTPAPTVSVEAETSTPQDHAALDRHRDPRAGPAPSNPMPILLLLGALVALAALVTPSALARSRPR